MTMSDTLELYIHIPFCERKCLYCDFLSAPAPYPAMEQYVDKLVDEIRAQGACFKERIVPTVFFGGGTPSILTPELFERIMTALRESFNIDYDAEITLEANPGTVTEEKAQAYVNAGVNRISLGLQSADDHELRRLGRIHTFSEFLKSYQTVRMAGIENVNVDLMSGIPGQSVDSWKKTLKKVLMLKPDHISAYSLIIEEDTPFYDQYGPGAVRPLREGWLPLPDEDTDREMYHLTKEMLAEHGYERYEISNYAKPGKECAHNIGYWTGVDYLGLGLGASSLIMDCRYHNTENFREYLSLDLTQPGIAARDVEELTKKDQIEEFMFLGLRMMKGVSGAEFMRRFDENLWNVYSDVIPKLEAQGLLEEEPPYLRLTDYGIDVSNVVFEQFMLDD